ncbi:MAG: ABC transporter ATP-binding protein/permease [Coriobacteriia bacterium]|nr:ABC transporter ATP-binding protein/permease [Coriobacteriia bacterium]
MDAPRRAGRGRGSRPLTDAEKENAPKITWPLLKRVFSYLLPYWPRLLLVVSCILVSSWLSILPSVLVGRMVDEGFIGGNLDVLIRLIATSFGVLILSNLIGVLESWLNTWVAQHITFDMRNKMFAHLLNMSHRFFSSSRQGEVITRMTSDIGSVQSVISGTLTGLIQNIALVILAVFAMYQRNWILATAGVLLVPFLILPTKQVGNKRWDITYQAQAKSDEINQILSETMSVSGQMLVKLFSREKAEYAKYEKANGEMIDLNIKESMAGRWFRASMGTLMSSGPLVIYLVGGLLMLRYGADDLTVGDITVMVALLERLYRPVNMLLNMQVEIIRSMALFTRIFEYYDMPLEIINKEDALVPAKMVGSLQFKDVGFHYSPETPILENIDFSVQQGRSVAIVGPSGAGKSTIINLIPRLYDVVTGQVLLDGIDVRDLDLGWLRSNIGLVTQDSYLFNGTVRENLLYAAPNATEADLVKACKDANIHDFIMSLPLAYDTEVGNRGIKLSGGERQRISIARVILKDPGMVILDEATSSLDSISESLIQGAIEPLLKGKTSLVIAHRLSTIMACDEILVIDEGRLVERGTHEELLAKGGVYLKLYETQFRRAIEDAEQRYSEKNLKKPQGPDDLRHLDPDKRPAKVQGVERL